MKGKNMKKTFLGIGLLALTAGVLSSCGEVTTASIIETYIGSHVVEVTSTGEYEGVPYTIVDEYYYYEQLQLLNDGTYEMTQTQTSTSAYYVTYATGIYEKLEEDATYDGYTEINIEDATYLQINQDIYNHMFSLTIDSESSTFPHEVAGGATVTKDELLSLYGQFGNRFILETAVESDINVCNWIDIESDINVVE
jgi:hypothetical protein